jgi:hypothetical protein
MGLHESREDAAARGFLTDPVEYRPAAPVSPFMKTFALALSILGASTWLLAGRVEAGGPAQKCSAAKDCRGMLPHYIRQCADGGFGAPLHWACEEGACVTRGGCK